MNQPYISIYPLPLASPSHAPYLMALGGHKAPSWSPCAMRLLPTSYLFYIWWCIYVHTNLLLHPSLPFSLPVSSSPFSTSASLFLSYPWFFFLCVCEFLNFILFILFIQQVLISHQFYTHQYIHVNPNGPIHHTTIPTYPRLSPLDVHTFVLYICVSIYAL